MISYNTYIYIRYDIFGAYALSAVLVDITGPRHGQGCNAARCVCLDENLALI